jgi:anaphase-promoting complex subunit 6
VKALTIASLWPDAAWEPTVSNLGHALRKLRRWPEALDCYRRALGLRPGRPGTHAAMGLTHHLLGSLDEAVEAYHKALSLRPEDAFVAEMLADALAAASESFAAGLGDSESDQHL